MYSEKHPPTQAEATTSSVLPHSRILYRLQALADEVSASPRLTRAAVMRILRRCYEEGLAEITPHERDALLCRIGATRKAEGANRSYAMASRKNNHTLVVRVVFASEKERANASRYSTALNYLAKQGVKPEKFDDALAELGGLTGAYWEARGRAGKTMRRNKLTLSTTIAATAGQEIVLRLLPRANGVFDVISVTQSAP